MITGEQIRGARAMLDWKQSDLAEKTGLSLPSINNIERLQSSPRVSTLNTIRNALQGAGIEFIGTTGVQLHSEVFEMREFKGDDFIEKLNDDLFTCMRNDADEVLIYGIDERMYPRYPEQMLRYYHHQIASGFRERILARDKDDFFLSPVQSYRWISAELLGVIPYYVYHDRVAMIMWAKKRVILIRSRDISDTFCQQFEFLWAMAGPVPDGAVNKLDDAAYRGKFGKAHKK